MRRRKLQHRIVDDASAFLSESHVNFGHIAGVADDVVVHPPATDALQKAIGKEIGERLQAASAVNTRTAGTITFASQRSTN